MKKIKIRCIHNCLTCKKEVLKTKKNIENSKNGKFYCNRECMRLDRNQGKEYPCVNCGELKYHPPRIVKRNKNLFCSRKCYDSYQNTSLSLNCEVCGVGFLRQNAQYMNNKKHYCSVDCRNKGIKTSVLLNCCECEKEIEVHKYKIKNSNSGKHFCSKSCTGKYYTRNKTFGVNRSRFEEWVEDKLLKRYVDLEFDFNNKSETGYELDIFVPKLNIAFEINGITHYKPIYGEERLRRTKEIDFEKKVICESKGIDMIIVDVSSIRNWSPEKTKEHYDSICKIIDDKIIIKRIFSNED